MTLMIFLLLVAVFIVAAASMPTTHSDSTHTSISTPIPTPEEEYEVSDEEREAHAMKNREELRQLIDHLHETKDDDSWMERTKENYPVFRKKDGTYEARYTDKDGQVYTCPCSAEPDAKELWFIMMEISDQKHRRVYGQPT